MREIGQKSPRRMRASISQKTLFSILLIALALGVTAIVIGYSVYSSTMDDHYLDNTIKLAHTISALVDQDTVQKYGELILGRYNESTEEMRENQEEDAYRDLYLGIEENEDYQRVRDTLIKIKEENDVMYAYIMVIDKAQEVCLYIADGETDEETYSAPGVWEVIEKEQADSLRKGTEAVITNMEEFGWLSSGGAPICVWDNGVFAAAIIDISMDEVMHDRHQFLRNYCIIMLLVIAVICLFATWAIRRQVVVPVNKLARAAEKYSYDRAHHEAGKMLALNHFSELNIKTGDELENLSAVMDDLETQLGEYIDNLTFVTAEKERIGTELNVATKIQADMLPRIFPAFPDRKDLDIYASMHPAKEVGGDFYDFFFIDDDRICLVMADVSGKGVPAALFMVIAKTLIKNRAMAGDSPAGILAHVNEQLCDGNEEEMFVTVWVAVIDLKTGKGMAANAGHEHPVIRRKGGDFELVIYRHSPAVAVMEGMRFKEHEFQLNPGDSLFVYTDGVTEATNRDSQLFGTERMLAALNRMPNVTPEDQLRSVRRGIDAFVKGAPQFDDITMMSFLYLGPEDKKDA